MENIILTNNKDLRLVGVKVGVLSTLRFELPLVSASATHVEVIVTSGDIPSAYTATFIDATKRWQCDIAASQFPTVGKQSYEVAYVLDGKQFWDGKGWIEIEDATTSGIEPQPRPEPYRYAVVSVNGYGADAQGAVRIPKTFIATNSPTTTEGFMEGDICFNRETGATWTLCNVQSTLTWVFNYKNYYTKAETEEAIDRVAAYYITYDAAGNPFPTYAALSNATTVYSGGKVRIPTRNDYCVVLADETHQGAEYRYIYAVAEGQTTGSWQAQFPVEGVMTIDQTVTKDSANPVAGGGVWSALWGELTKIPYSLTSVYDWAKCSFASPFAIAPKFDLGETYSVGDVRIEVDVVGGSGLLYRCKEGYRPDGESNYPSGDSEHWEVIDVKTLLAGKLDKSGGTMTGGLTVKNFTVGSRKSNSTVGINSTAEGFHTEASGVNSHAEGTNTEASGESTHAEGYNTTAQNSVEHAQGRFNASHKASTTFGDAGNTLSSIGFGTADNARKNAVETMQDGKTYIYGLGGYDGTNPTATGVKDLAAEVNVKASRAEPNHTGNLAALDAQGNPTDAGWTASDLARYALVTKTISNGAVSLDDRAINAVAVSSSLASLTINFPTATTGKARDFGLRLTVASGITTAPQIVLPQGVTCENADGEAPEIGADGAATILYFTETASGVFLVKGEVLTAITA